MHSYLNTVLMGRYYLNSAVYPSLPSSPPQTHPNAQHEPSELARRPLATTAGPCENMLKDGNIV